MFFKNKQFNIILVLLLVVLVLVFISMQLKTTSSMEGFTSDDNIQTIKTGVENIDKKLSTGYPDMSKFALKSQLDPSRVFKVADAVDKDRYILKTEAEKLAKCPVPADYDPSKFISKSLADPLSCPTCPTIDTTKFLLKSTLPAVKACPPCIFPEVKVSAGLCKTCPPPPKCPEPKPCPLPVCPEPMPCPPQRECPAPLPAEPCPPKICPSCPVPPKATECPKCCDRDVIKVLKKTVYVDKTGNELSSEDQIMSNDINGSYGNLEPAPTFGSGLATPKPLLNIGSASTSTGGTLNEQSNAGLVNYSNFSSPTEAPFVQSFKLKSTNFTGNNKTCNPNGFNSEFKQFGVYGNNNNKSMFN